MNSKEDIKPISFIKSHAAEILNQVNETHRPIYVTQNGEAKAVLIDTESFESMKNALSLLKLLAIGENDMAHKKFKPQKDVFDSLEKKLLKKKSENG